MGKPESFSFHSSILHAVDLFLKLHRHKYGKKIRKHGHWTGESASPEKHPENIYFKTFIFVFAQLRLAALLHPTVTSCSQKRHFMIGMSESNLSPFYRPGKWGLSFLSALYLSALEPPWNSASAETRAAFHCYTGFPIVMTSLHCMNLESPGRHACGNT